MSRQGRERVDELRKLIFSHDVKLIFKEETNEKVDAN